MIPPAAFLVVAIVLFALGAAGFFVKKDLLTQFMAVEVMLNAANLAFLALSRAAGAAADGQVIVFFVLTVAAAEAVVGMAIVLAVYRRRKSIRTEDASELKG